MHPSFKIHKKHTTYRNCICLSQTVCICLYMQEMPTMCHITSTVMQKIVVKFERNHPLWGRQSRWGMKNSITFMNNYNYKKHMKNVGKIRHKEPPHARCHHCTVARRPRIDVHDANDDNDNA